MVNLNVSKKKSLIVRTTGRKIQDKIENFWLQFVGGVSSVLKFSLPLGLMSPKTKYIRKTRIPLALTLCLTRYQTMTT